MIKCSACPFEGDESQFLDKKGNIVKKCYTCRKQTNDWKSKNKERIKLYNEFYRKGQISEKTYVYAKKKEDEIWIKFDSQLEAAKKLELNAPNINKVIKGILKSTGGYNFKLETEKIEKYEKKWDEIKTENNLNNIIISSQRIEHEKIDNVIGKKCCTCKDWKPLENYNYSKDHWDNLRNDCKVCLADWRKKNRKAIQKTNTAYEKKRKKEDPTFKLIKTLRSRLGTALRSQNVKKNNTTMTLIGETPAFVKNYLEERFEEGMTWENHGDWHIDHIKPCKLFNLLKEEEQNACFHYTNLQPLWGTLNISKGSKYSLEDKKLFEKERNAFLKYLLDNNLDKPDWMENETDECDNENDSDIYSDSISDDNSDSDYNSDEYQSEGLDDSKSKYNDDHLTPIDYKNKYEKAAIELMAIKEEITDLKTDNKKIKTDLEMVKDELKTFKDILREIWNNNDSDSDTECIEDINDNNNNNIQYRLQDELNKIILDIVKEKT